MARRSLFERLKAYVRTKKSRRPPPAYTEPRPPLSMPSQKLATYKERGETQRDATIASSSIPQWVWTNAQCQQWLCEVIISRLGRTEEDAESISQRFKGSGPDIYLMRLPAWQGLVGRESAHGLYFWLLTVRHEKGAIPRTIQMRHGYSKKELNGVDRVGSVPYMME